MLKLLEYMDILNKTCLSLSLQLKSMELFKIEVMGYSWSVFLFNLDSDITGGNTLLLTFSSSGRAS